MACITCPFACTEESEIAQNYGCLPTPYDVIQMKKTTGNNWACHSNDDIACRGLSEYIAEENLPYDISTGELVKWSGVHGVDQNSEGTYPC